MGDQSGSAIGGQQGGPTVNYNTRAPAIADKVREGQQFILLVRGHQSEGFQVWSSGDKVETTEMYRQAATQIAELTTA